MKVNTLAILSIVATAQAQSLGDQIGGAIDGVADDIDNVGDDISSGINDGLNEVSSRINDGVNGIETIASDIASRASDAASRASDAFDDASTFVDGIITRASTAFDAIETGFDGAFSDVSDFVDGIPGAWSSRVDEIEDSLDSISDREQYISRITAGLDDARASLSNVLATATGAVAAEASDALVDINDLYSSVNGRFTDAAQSTDPEDRAPAITAAAFMGALFGGAAMMANM